MLGYSPTYPDIPRCTRHIKCEHAKSYDSLDGHCAAQKDFTTAHWEWDHTPWTLPTTPLRKVKSMCSHQRNCPGFRNGHVRCRSTFAKSKTQTHLKGFHLSLRLRLTAFATSSVLPPAPTAVLPPPSLEPPRSTARRHDAAA